MNRCSFIEKTLKGQSEKFLCPVLAEGHQCNLAESTWSCFAEGAFVGFIPRELRVGLADRALCGGSGSA
eukprot:symbB.v1.2.005812.t1/scaffold342.1/size227955/5